VLEVRRFPSLLVIDVDVVRRGHAAVEGLYRPAYSDRNRVSQLFAELRP
jgi:hypothetical protein